MATPAPITGDGDTLVTEGRLRIAANVRALMGRGRTPTSGRRVTQAELSREVGVGQSGMSERLAGKVPFDTDELLRVARFFEVGVADLMEDVRSRCFAPFSLVNDDGQMELALGLEPPVLATVAG